MIRGVLLGRLGFCAPSDPLLILKSLNKIGFVLPNWILLVPPIGEWGNGKNPQIMGKRGQEAVDLPVGHTP